MTNYVSRRGSTQLLWTTDHYGTDASHAGADSAHLAVSTAFGPALRTAASHPPSGSLPQAQRLQPVLLGCGGQFAVEGGDRCHGPPVQQGRRQVSGMHDTQSGPQRQRMAAHLVVDRSEVDPVHDFVDVRLGPAPP